DPIDRGQGEVVFHAQPTIAGGGFGAAGGGALAAAGGEDDVGELVAGVLHRGCVDDVDAGLEADVRAPGPEAGVAELETLLHRPVRQVAARVRVLRCALLGDEV